MKIIKIIAYSFILVFCLGYFKFNSTITNISNYNRYQSDIIAVIGENNIVIDTAIRLLKRGYSRILFIPNEKKCKDYIKQLTEHNIIPEQLICAADKDFYTNNMVLNISNFMQNNNFTSVRVVAESDQIDRFNLEAYNRMPSGSIIIDHPVIIHTKNYYNIAKEYTKYVVTYIFSIIGYEHELNLSYS